MKPTKEQLADPKWWDDNADPLHNYCYMDKTDGQWFTAYHFDNGVDGFELLAKRPEPEWVPEVGECFEFSANGVSWEQREMVYADDYSILMANKKYPANRWLYKTNDPNLMYRPIKTQREELIDLVATALQTDDQDVTELCNKSKSMFMSGATKSVDAILARFDLTEKDGE